MSTPLFAPGKYNVIKDGKVWSIVPDTLERTIAVIQLLESRMDRNTQHSPYTILPATK
jgi:hypothetical protein